MLPPAFPQRCVSPSSPSRLLAVPLASDAQPPAHIPTVGVLAPNRPPLDTDPSSGLNAFRQGLRDLGYLEGQNIQLEYYYAEGQLDGLPTLAADLVNASLTSSSTWLTAGALAAQQATTTIPIVVGAATDLVAQGIVTSLARPAATSQGWHCRAPYWRGNDSRCSRKRCRS